MTHHGIEIGEGSATIGDLPFVAYVDQDMMDYIVKKAANETGLTNTGSSDAHNNMHPYASVSGGLYVEAYRMRKKDAYT